MIAPQLAWVALALAAAAHPAEAQTQIDSIALDSKIYGQVSVFRYEDELGVSGDAFLAYRIQYASPNLLKVDFSLRANSTLVYSGSEGPSTVHLNTCQLPCQDPLHPYITDLKALPMQQGYTSLFVSYFGDPRYRVQVPMYWLWTPLNDESGNLSLIIEGEGFPFMLSSPTPTEETEFYNGFTLLLNADAVPI